MYFQGFFAHCLGAAFLRGVLNACFYIKYMFYDMTHTHYNIFIITIRGVLGIHQASKMELQVQIVTAFNKSNIFAKVSILYVCLVFQFASEYFANTCDRLVYFRREQLIDTSCSPLTKKPSKKLYEIFQASDTSTICYITCNQRRVLPGIN